MLLVAGFGALTAPAEIIIDDFSAGNVHLFAQNGPGQHGIHLSHLEPNLPAEHTIAGSRMTWVETGMDYSPSIADLLNGAMRFQIDNDECQAGLDYYGVRSAVDLTQAGLNDRINYDINYQVNGGDSTVVVYVTLEDNLLRSRTLNFEVGRPGHPGFYGFSGTYSFNLADFAPVDPARIISIDFRFWGGANYGGWFEVDNITAVPEPAGIALLLLTAVFRRR